MWYTLEYANTLIYTPAHGGRAGNPRNRTPVPVRLYGTSLPDAPGQCRRATDHRDCASVALHRSDGAQCHSCLSPAWPRRAPAAIVAAAYPVGALERQSLRIPPGAVTSKSSDLW